MKTNVEFREPYFPPNSTPIRPLGPFDDSIFQTESDSQPLSDLSSIRGDPTRAIDTVMFDSIPSYISQVQPPVTSTRQFAVPRPKSPRQSPQSSNSVQVDTTVLYESQGTRNEAPDLMDLEQDDRASLTPPDSPIRNGDEIAPNVAVPLSSASSSAPPLSSASIPTGFVPQNSSASTASVNRPSPIPPSFHSSAEPSEGVPAGSSSSPKSVSLPRSPSASVETSRSPGRKTRSTRVNYSEMEEQSSQDPVRGSEPSTRTSKRKRSDSSVAEGVSATKKSRLDSSVSEASSKNIETPIRDNASKRSRTEERRSISAEITEFMESAVLPPLKADLAAIYPEPTSFTPLSQSALKSAFKGISFCITGVKNQHTELLNKLVQRMGGTLVDTPSLKKTPVQRRLGSTSRASFRTAPDSACKFHASTIIGFSTLPEMYFRGLQTGFDMNNTKRSQSDLVLLGPTDENTLFAKAERVEVVGDPEFKKIWEGILSAAGAKIVDRLFNPNSGTVEYVVSDQEPAMLLRDAAEQRGLPLCTVEWVVQCLVEGKLLDPHSRREFVVSN